MHNLLKSFAVLFYLMCARHDLNKKHLSHVTSDVDLFFSNENFVVVNDRNSGILILSTVQNMDCLCDVDELFIDGTFKCCPKYFYQLYSIHGCKNGNYVPLVFALLPSKSEECYLKMWSFIQNSSFGEWI